MLEVSVGDFSRSRPAMVGARWSASRSRFQRIGAPFEAAQARIELAMSLAAVGRIVLAEREATAALDRLVELGAEAEAERARRLLEVSVRGDGPGLPGVTRREREVLALLAEGLTNRQIAERLVVRAHRRSSRHQHPAKARPTLTHARARGGARPGFLEFATRANSGSSGGPAEYRYEYVLVVSRKRAA